MYKNLPRLANPDVRFNFEAINIKSRNRIFGDHNRDDHFQNFANQGKNISKFPSYATVRYHN